MSSLKQIAHSDTMPSEKVRRTKEDLTRIMQSEFNKLEHSVAVLQSQLITEKMHNIRLKKEIQALRECLDPEARAALKEFHRDVQF